MRRAMTMGTMGICAVLAALTMAAPAPAQRAGARDSSGAAASSSFPNSTANGVNGGVNEDPILGGALPGAVPRGGSAANNMPIGNPEAVAFDTAGGYYIASGYNRVYHVDKGGKLALYAGTGLSGRAGDGGPATAAQLDCPTGLAVDGGGNLFIAEGCSGVIRRVDVRTQEIATYVDLIFSGAGPANGASRDAGRGAGATVAAGGNGGTSALTQAACPNGIALDASGNLYIADNCSRKVWRVEAASRAVAAYAGTGDQGYSGNGGPAAMAQLGCPYGVTVDGAGNLYIADGCDNVVRRVDVATKVIANYAGTSAFGRGGDGGLATAAQMGCPFGVAFDGGGNLFIAEDCTRMVRRVDGASKVISPYAGNGTTGRDGDGGSATAAQLGCPYGLAADRAGNLLIADTCNREVRRVDAATKQISTVAGNGS